MTRPYQLCTRCIMDTSATEITFGANGHCNFCIEFFETLKQLPSTPEEKNKKLQAVVEKIKKEGKGKEYDCVIGVSGGVDSTYIAYKVKELGLRPLAIHFDNGWNSELAVSNIEKIMKQLDIDLYTYVVDWDEFKSLQQAFLRASVPNNEIPSDHGINAILYKTCVDKKVPYLITGSNFATEGILPVSWGYDAMDLRYITTINNTFGTQKLKSFPRWHLWQYMYHMYLRKQIRKVRLLDYIDYNKKEAKDLLINTLGWKDYGGKHFESIYTRFHQAYLLPKKFHADKRRAHLATLVCSGQMTREDAIEEMKQPPAEAHRLEEDRAYVCKKLDISEEEFKRILETPIKSYRDYKNHAQIMEWLRRLKQLVKKLCRK